MQGGQCSFLRDEQRYAAVEMIGMHIAALGLLLTLAACTSPIPSRDQCPRCYPAVDGWKRNAVEVYEQAKQNPDPPFDVEASHAGLRRRAREDELLERALANSPDYTSALRRAAIANVDAEAPFSPGSRRTQAEIATAREQRIAAEEARLSDAIEVRRRGELAQRQQEQQQQQDKFDRVARLNAARAACDAQASAVGAGIYTPYSPRAGVLGSALTGAIASASAETQARAGCYRAYGL
jgi:hypothetical protein